MICKPCKEGRHAECESAECDCPRRKEDEAIDRQLRAVRSSDENLAETVYSTLLYGGSDVARMLTDGGGKEAVRLFTQQICGRTKLSTAERRRRWALQPHVAVWQNFSVAQSPVREVACPGENVPNLDFPAIRQYEDVGTWHCKLLVGGLQKEIVAVFPAPSADIADEVALVHSAGGADQEVVTGNRLDDNQTPSLVTDGENHVLQLVAFKLTNCNGIA